MEFNPYNILRERKNTAKRQKIAAQEEERKKQERQEQLKMGSFFGKVVNDEHLMNQNYLDSVTNGTRRVDTLDKECPLGNGTIYMQLLRHIRPDDGTVEAEAIRLTDTASLNPCEYRRESDGIVRRFADEAAGETVDESQSHPMTEEEFNILLSLIDNSSTYVAD